ncbi:MAG TPA: VWA domain-containing protein, partial [Terriglobales bacterium]|nr:VWA domain-containing protein [Terriglobales bacterium]
MKLFPSNRAIFAWSLLCLFAAALLAAAQDVPVFRSEVGVVNIFFNVKDKHGALVPNLSKNDFQLFEDGKPQTIKYFRLAADQPLTLGMLIDTSASQERVLRMEKEVGAEFLRQTLQKNDLAFVISFDVN